ncbi:4-hydroxy-3-methylbut-2-enyl diphosphate reductase [Hyphococcus sp. DH-69]|uniref:4-hydroxy-3-methylbut-2-enyl diphosphate reductase n=1 Tax=Hyphococcus formosus TaxID=3143534 RepID=UPI00398B78C6
MRTEITVPTQMPKGHTKSRAKPQITVRMASPRGFCAGVERAIKTVEETLSIYGAPVYVRHEIVHNAHVVARLSAMGAVFVESIDEAPDDRPIVFSAHGAPQSAHAAAEARNLVKIDATCPLVLKVHTQAKRHVAAGRQVLLIGHANHPEVVGTMGQADDGEILLVQTIEEANTIAVKDERALAYATQTTLSVDDTAGIIAALKKRFPDIAGPAKEDICYATSNRQKAVKTAAPGADLFIVIGSPTSSNSVRLVETAKAAGARDAILVEDADQFDWSILEGVSTIGMSAGASAPEHLVEAFLTALANRRTLDIKTIETAKENVVFNTPLRLAS